MRRIIAAIVGVALGAAGLYLGYLLMFRAERVPLLFALASIFMTGLGISATWVAVRGQRAGDQAINNWGQEYFYEIWSIYRKAIILALCAGIILVFLFASK
jgi:hypothetical protein